MKFEKKNSKQPGKPQNIRRIFERWVLARIKRFCVSYLDDKKFDYKQQKVWLETTKSLEGALNIKPFKLQTFQNIVHMNIQILGTGCPKCKSLEKATREVVDQNGIEATITKVEDIVEIMKFNIMSTPALVIDGKVVIKGRVPSNNELKVLLTNKI